MKYILIFVFALGCVMNTNAQVDKYKDLMSQDWPNLKKYRADNEKVIAADKKIKAVFMGNSITEGWANMHPDFFTANNYLGRGISGQTTPQMLIRFTPDVLDLNPKVVVILAGTNDIAGNTGFSSEKMIEDNITAMALLAKSHHIKVILCSILPVYDYPWRPGLEPIQKISNINNWMKNFAKKNGFHYLDYYSEMVNDQKGMKANLSKDGVHPNSAGYDVMEPLVIKAVNKII
ncbi:SGNH/GDSL hydrolase family protein [Zhouia sp. PK063]|uniref:SGNH/GDSL hydrolase family protein n=1 Tax=Zhouia sp. PK063 TaxID=3373602 RepID=UPI00379060B4